MTRGGAGALLTVSDAISTPERVQLLKRAARRRPPVMFSDREYVEAGGLMSYGTNFPDQYRCAATYVDKILKGAKPADLPVEQPTRFDLAINMKTAKALGIKIPNSILVQATKGI